MIDVSARITYFREMKGWSEYQLAEMSSIPQSTINSWSRTDSIPSLKSIERLCETFGITIAQFFSEETPIDLTETQRKLLDASNHLDNEQLDKLIAFIEAL